MVRLLNGCDEYLRPRSYRVAINGTYSKDRNLEVSIPQGSCEGANIFNLYCSPLQDMVPEDLQLSGFADDHSVRKTFKAGNNKEERDSIEKNWKAVYLTLSSGWMKQDLR